MFFTQRTLVPMLGSLVKYKSDGGHPMPGGNVSYSKIHFSLYLVVEIGFQM